MGTKTATRAEAGYEADFDAWILDQAEKLRSTRPNSLDWENIAEELESLGRSDRHEIQSRLAVLIAHLLKWRYQPDWRSKSWEFTIRTQRREIQKKLKQSPSLRNFALQSVAEVYDEALESAVQETGLFPDSFPASCPFTELQILDPAFMPEDMH